MRRYRLAATLALPLLLACAGHPYRSADHPIKRLSYWKTPPKPGPLAEKLQPIPPEVLDYIRKDNVLQGFPPDTIAAPPSPELDADVRKALAELPNKVQQVVSERLYGIFPVHKLGGTAFTDAVWDHDRHPIGAFMLIDSEVLNRTANAWASWKENTPFAADPAWKLELQIETKRRDDRAHAIQYILLHEFGHVLSLDGQVHPPWDAESAKAHPPQDFEYSKLSWKLDEKGRAISLFDDEFAERAKIKYYVDPPRQRPLAAAAEIYDKLGRTNFVTLYGVTNMSDDFAEAFASYVHTVLLKRPWKLTLLKDGKVVQTFGPCWKEERCRAKQEFIRKHFGL